MPAMHTHEDPPRAGQRTARFAPSSMSTIWTKVKNHLTPPSHPSTTSESAVDSSFNNTENLYLGATSEHGGVNGPTLDLLNPMAGTTSKYKKTRRRPKSSAANSNSRYGDDEDLNANPSEPFEHVVVDNDFEHFVPPAARSEGGSTNAGISKNSGTGLFSRTSKDEEKEEDMEARATRSDMGSIRRDRRQSWVKRSMAYEFVVERLWPNLKHFFDSSFPEPSKERAFQKEVSLLISQ